MPHATLWASFYFRIKEQVISPKTIFRTFELQKMQVFGLV
jgi:hypothetical protein